jgi:hypothetical protein
MKLTKTFLKDFFEINAAKKWFKMYLLHKGPKYFGTKNDLKSNSQEDHGRKNDLIKSKIVKKSDLPAVGRHSLKS